MHLDFGNVEFIVQPSDTIRSYSKDLQVMKLCTGLNKIRFCPQGGIDISLFGYVVRKTDMNSQLISYSPQK